MTIVGPAKRAAHFQLSSCTTDYLRALTDPFTLPPKELPCIPDLFDSPSKKLRVVQRGMLTSPGTGAGAYTGFLMFDVRNGICRDFTTVAYSGATYASDGFPLTYAMTGVNETGMNQSPYSNADFSDSGAGNMQYRPVAAGIRVRYAGTELERGGVTIPFRHPQNREITGYSTANVLSFQEVRRLPCNRAWHGIMYIPVNSGDYEYGVGVGAQPEPGVAGSIGILLKSGGVNATNWEWEVVAYYEVVGATENVTPSHSDVGGMSAVRTFLEGGFDGDPSTTLYQEAAKKISNLTPNDISGFASGIYTGFRAAGML